MLCVHNVFVFGRFPGNDEQTEEQVSLKEWELWVQKCVKLKMQYEMNTHPYLNNNEYRLHSN